MISSTKRRVIIERADTTYSCMLGLYFGYPECCARSFMEHHSGLTYGDMEFPLCGSGFVPCPKCAATYTDDELVEYIEANRYCPVPFPDGSTINFDINTNDHMRAFAHTLMTTGVEIGRTTADSHAASIG